MDDLRARYLRQQIELGGDEIVLRRPLRELRAEAPAASVPVPRAPDTQVADAPPSSLDEGPPPLEPEESLMADRADASADGPAREHDERPKWLVGAPPIPGPGLTVTFDPGLAGADAWSDLAAVAADVLSCRQCPLCEGRTQAVPGEGNPEADLMFVGEGPGAKEDETGRPFVGKAGELLNGILGAIGLAREDVFIANVVKCRPPQNRKPLPDEQEACLPYLRRQIALVRPKVLVALGGTAAEALLGVKESLGRLRLQVHSYDGIPLVVTYHPAALLRNPHWKKPTWDDVRIARQLLDR